MVRALGVSRESAPAGYALFESREVPKGWYLARAGTACTEIAFIRRGLFKLHGTNSTGSAFIVAFAAEQSFVTDYTAMVRGEKTLLDIEALEPSTIEVITFESYRRLLKFGAEWQDLCRQLIEQTLANVTQREFEFLTMTASERYEAFLERNPGIVPRISRQDIAAYLGITPVSLSRLTARLRKERDDRE